MPVDIEASVVRTFQSVTGNERKGAQVVGVSFRPGQIERIDAAAEATEHTRSSLIRVAVESYLRSLEVRPARRRRAAKRGAR